MVQEWPELTGMTGGARPLEDGTTAPHRSADETIRSNGRGADRVRSVSGVDDLVAREVPMKVLVPYDGGELSEQAAVMAMKLLAQRRLELLLLRVTPGPDTAADARESLETVAGALSRSAGL